MYPFLLISRRMSAVIAVALLLGVTSVPQAQAGYTAVRQPKRVTEPSHEQILERMYGGNFVADASGLNFSNESGVTVTRLDDTAAASATASTDESWPTRNTSAGRGRKASRMFSSIAGPNRDDTDPLVSHQVDTPGEGNGATTYLLCWEDKLGQGSDRDYNDTVGEIKPADAADAGATAAALAEPLLIPLPPAVRSGLGGLVGLGLLGAMRRSTRWLRR